MKNTEAAELSSWVLQEAVDTVGVDDKEVQRSKNDGFSYVTNTDEKLDDEIREKLVTTSGFPVLSEESDTVPDTDEYWVVDPIDGTIPFAHGLPNYATMAAFVKDNVPVASSIYFPEMDEVLASNGTTVWVEGTELETNAQLLTETVVFSSVLQGEAYSNPQHRALHKKLNDQTLVFSTYCAGFGISTVAKGDAGFAVYVNLSEWDYMPTIPILEAAGGVVGSLETGETGLEAVQDVNGNMTCFAASNQLFEECKRLYDASSSPDN